MKSVILVAQGVQDEEFIYPYYRLQEEGEVIVVGSTRTQKGETLSTLTGKYGIPLKPYYDSIQLTDSIFDDVDLVIIPGGWECPEILRMDPAVIEYVQKMAAKGTVIGAICHGPQVLISARLVRGRLISCFMGMKDDVINAGATFNTFVSVDSNIVTAAHYRDNPQFVKACIHAVRESAS